MNDRPRNKRFLIAGLILLLPIVFVILLKQGSFSTQKRLPILGERYLPKDSKDTVYHTVGPFTLIDQTGDTITEKDVAGKIRVVNFFFARCQGVCPKMNHNLEMAYDDFKNDTNIVFISHTVDPENDSAEVLMEYSRHFAGVKPKRWYFVTGTPAMIARMQNEYLLPKADNSSTDQISHSQNIILVDKEGRVRGFYDGLKPNEIKSTLKDHLKLLLYEYKK